MIYSSILQKVIAEVDRIFEKEISERFVYHNKAHTQSVVDHSDYFAQHLDLSGADRELLAIAAWFHDVGYSKGYENHEDSGEKMARVFLTTLNISKREMDLIAGCIQATKVGTEPTTIMEQIIKDSDLANLGQDSFLGHSKRLREEWFDLLGEYHTDKEWNELNQNFLSQHIYYSSIANEELTAKKLANLELLRQEIN
ncbi:MAG: putative metal-dependent HD superfamily phosphohydrolase [Polaribacter sp.]|jgi:predicted metal-dependent HD superfamily phosphohydrolase